jgi:superfamily II DNA/RNA helicase
MMMMTQQQEMSTVNTNENHHHHHNRDNKNEDFYDPTIFDDSVTNFATLGIQSKVLLQRLHQQQLYRPTKVQIASYPVIASLSKHNSNIREDDSKVSDTQAPSTTTIPKHTDVTIACETGSGKTLAYLLPLIDDILQRKAAAMSQILSMDRTTGTTNQIDHARRIDVGYDYARALILVPNKELVQQVVRMAVPLSGGAQHAVIYGGHTLPDPSILDRTLDNDNNVLPPPPPPHEIVRIAIMPGGLREPLDFAPFRQTVAIGGGTQPPIDLLISTPASVGPLALSPKHIAFFADIQTIVIDEADMLLDGGYIRALENVLMGFKRADRLDAVKYGEIPKTQHIFVAATLPNYGLRSVDAYLSRKFPNAKRIELDSLHMARHSGLIQPTVWMEMESKRDRMMKLVELFQEDSTDSLQKEKVMIFLNSVADCEASCEALQRAGIHCAPYHAQIPLPDRTVTLERFRKYQVAVHNDHDDDDDDDNNNNNHNTDMDLQENDMTSPIPVLVCTDLASRGLDVPGVSVVVQLQFCGNVVSHLHRMGRCGRGGNQRQYGRGYVFYGIKERALVETVQAAELEQEQMVLPGDVVTNDWDSQNEDVIINDTTTTTDSSSVSANQQKTIESTSTMGKVTTAFSRKRGFTKKLKKLRRGSGIDDGERDIEQE